MKTEQLEFPQTPSRRASETAAPVDWARPSQVDRGLVPHSIAALRDRPKAAAELRAWRADKLDGIRAIDRLYGDDLNEWARQTRERLWREVFAAEAVLKDLSQVDGQTSSGAQAGQHAPSPTECEPPVA